MRSTYPNLAVSGVIIANCIRLLVTSRGYDIDCATAPANPPHNNLAGIVNTKPPTNIWHIIIIILDY